MTAQRFSTLVKRIRWVRNVLKKHFPVPSIPLHHRDPFTLLVAVVLSAQCTDKLVNKITPALFERAGTPFEMAAMSHAELLRYIRPCGLAPTKAKNLIATAKILVEKFNGKVPCNRESLQELPGVGRKTASVVLSQAFNIPALPVDTHILRSAVRWGLSSGQTPEAIEADLCALFPRKEWNLLHLRMILYARNFCTARGCVGPKKEGKRCELCEGLRISFGKNSER